MDPSFVPKWEYGDCDGDGRLTGNDYQIAFRVSQAYNKLECPAGDSDDAKVYRSLLQVPGIKGLLKHADIPTIYARYLLEHGVPKSELNMGNNKEDKQ